MRMTATRSVHIKGARMAGFGPHRGVLVGAINVVHVAVDVELARRFVGQACGPSGSGGSGGEVSHVHGPRLRPGAEAACPRGAGGDYGIAPGFREPPELWDFPGLEDHRSDASN
jgi:hypothetical protein